LSKRNQNRQPVPKQTNKRKPVKSAADIDDFPELSRVQKRIYRQAALAGLTVVLTIVILFAVTSAWYTNVVQTSGLVFQAEAWGFDGNILVNRDAIQAAPGDTGVVHLEVENKSDSISAISLSVSKANMEDVMKKRLFFYVDTRMTRNNEIMDRVYLNNYESYTYTLFGQGNLILTEQTNNAPQLKWHWVYDVLGYYVLGQPVTYSSVVAEEETQTGEAEPEEPLTRMSIRDYLRPIEYDYENAIFSTEEDEDGSLVNKLDSVDGLTPEAFLNKVFQTDGYPGNYVGEPVAGGYYPVDIDPNTGYGVYAYLCSPSDVVMENDEDRKLGELAYKVEKEEYVSEAEKKKLSSEAVLTISAQKNENTAVNVNTLNGLQAGIDQGMADLIQLGSDIHISSNNTLLIPSDSRVMVDLNGYTITSETGNAIKVQPGGHLTMLNGAMNCPEPDPQTKECAVYATGAEVVLSKVDMTGYDYGVYVGDHDGGNLLDSRVHMVDCEINAASCAVFVSGNGLLSAQKSQLIVERCILKSDLLTICGNGTATGNGQWGTDIQVIDSEVHGNVEKFASGIYQPQKDSTLRVYNSKVTGYNGIAIKGGHVIIMGSTIEGKGEKQEPSYSNSGFTDTGDAVYIDAGYGYEILLEIGNIAAGADSAGGVESKLTSLYSKSLQVYEENADNVAVKISGGLFQEELPKKYLVENAVQTNDRVTIVDPEG